MQQRDSDPGVMLADKGYDSDAIRYDLQDSGATPEIPTKRNRKIQYSVSKPLYALRSRIERFGNQAGHAALLRAAPDGPLLRGQSIGATRAPNDEMAALRDRVPVSRLLRNSN
jgi:hypothetical protein